MKLQKKIFTLGLIITFPVIGFGQKLKTNLFLRTPQVVNYNLNLKDISYSPVISVGAGISHKSKFIELGSFITPNDLYGFYTFFGTNIKTKELSKNLKLHTNLFGEVSYIPKQIQSSNSFTYTSGPCFFLNYSFEWGSIGLPLCIGAAYSQKSISLNTRTILNLSLYLN